MRKPQPFGKYLLLDRIAVGGMAEVFAAKAFGVEGFERVIAIKRILPTMVEDDEFIKMFIDEARIASQLSHANLVQIYDLGKHEDTYYIAMEYVSGRDVRLIIDKFKKRNETVPLAMAAYIMAKMCEGLDYAHRRKDAQGQDLSIIHRDISPQNVLVSYEGEVKIIDFGIAKAAGRAQKTQAGILKGKFGYMSPEQVRGMEIDHRTDIYSCGVMLYEMITGSKLFTGESDFSTLEKVRAGDVRPPTELNGAIPPDLEEIVLKALAKNRDERYQWASELGDDLMRFLYRSKDVFTGKSFAAFMKEAFGAELVKEGERQRRWQNTTAEETSDFELTPLSRSLEVAKAGAAPEPQNGRARIGPPSAFATAELRLQDRTTVSQPFDEAASQRASLATEAVSLAELGMMVGDSSQLPEPPPPKERPSLPFDVEARKRAPSRPPPARSPDPAPPVTDDDPAEAPLDQQATRVRAEPPPRSKPSAPPERPQERPAEPPRPASAAQQPPTRAVAIPTAPSRPSGLAKALVALGAVLALGAAGLGLRLLQNGQRGQLRLTARPPTAKVVVDGEEQEFFPLITVRLPLGEHRLKVSAEGHVPYDESFTIDSTKPLELTVELQKTAGSPPEPEPEPTPEPPPAAPAPVPPAVAVAPAAPRPAVAAVRPAAGGVAPAAARPAPDPTPAPDTAPEPASPQAGGEDGAPGGFAIFTSPPGAMVAIDRRFIGKAPARVTDLPGGKEVAIKVVLSGYKPVEMRKVVAGGKTESLKIELEAVEGNPVGAETLKALGGGGGGAVGKLTAMCMPKAQVFVDGKPTGRMTPVTQGSPLELPVGTHKVHCESESGARSEPKDVEITADAVASFRDRLPQ